jgi:segregation and condensation protein B
MDNIKNIIESLLFVADEPLSIERLKKIIVPAEAQEIREALAALTVEYESRTGGFFLDEVAGGYQIRTRPEYTEWIKKLIQPRPLRLSKASLETLVIIAYKQPIIRSDIEHLRGVDCGGVLRVLMERKLIRVLGRREIAGRPLIYATTKHFLEVFDLKTLRDLPTPKEIEELGASLSESGKSAMFEIDPDADDEEGPVEGSDTDMDESGSFDEDGPELQDDEPDEEEIPPEDFTPGFEDEPDEDTLEDDLPDEPDAGSSEKPE